MVEPIQGKSPKSPILVSGMGRSGTTWLAELLGSNRRFRVLFEPFLPAKVPEAAPFGYLPYIPPNNRETELVMAARNIFSGRVSGAWVGNQDAPKSDSVILVKDIRTNLMLAWLAAVVPGIRIVLVIRHPLQIVNSWMRLGWKTEAFGQRTNFDSILEQEDLLKDFPVIAAAARRIDPQDHFQDVVFQWCAYHLVPLSHLTADQAHVVFYEDLVLAPEATLQKLFLYLDIDFDWEAIEKIYDKPSKTNFLNRQHGATSEDNLIQSWQSPFSSGQLSWANEMFHEFGLAHLYDSQGRPTRDPWCLP